MKKVSFVFTGLLVFAVMANAFAGLDPANPENVFPYQDGFGTYALYHMDEVVHGDLTYTSGWFVTPDDNSVHPDRGYDASAKPYSWPSEDPLNPTSTYLGPPLVDSLSTNLNKCAYFNGYSHLFKYQKDGDLSFSVISDRSNFRVEVWAKLDRDGYGRDYDNTRYMMAEQNQLFSLRITDAAVDPEANPDGDWYVSWAVFANGVLAQDCGGRFFDAENWHHYAGEFNNGIQTLYIDGEMVSQVTAPFTQAGPANLPLIIGADGVEGEKWWGHMDEMRFAMADIPACGSMGYSDSDINHDCYVNFKDFAEMAMDWLICTDPTNSQCVDLSNQ